MRIFYDGFIFDFQQYGGINRYFNEIIARLPEDSHPIVSTFLGERDFWPIHRGRRIIRSRPFASMPSLSALGRAWMSLRVATTPVDVAHPTYFQRLTPGEVSRIGRPLVVTVFDMVHERFFEKSDPLGVVEAKRNYIEHADAILCISEHTREDMLNHFPQVEARTFVTPLGSSMNVSRATDYSLADTRPYFLYVGGRDGYKNFDVVLVALQEFAERNADALLKVVGNDWKADEQRTIARLRLERNVVHEGRADDDRLSSLYNRSIALIYPSLYEGFGIPLLEAMRCRTAVICSRTSSLPEVGGEAPLYFDPRNADELCAQMEAIANSSSLRLECVARGLLQESKFSWDNTADLTFAAYNRVVS